MATRKGTAARIHTPWAKISGKGRSRCVESLPVRIMCESSHTTQAPVSWRQTRTATK